ncbi:MAG: aspartate aminotransferase family protein [Thermoplasmata archaeon]|uniref:Aspartate aminotransferase family protein n=1 Tax=Candidatus Sysuiplasma superficiale TaxID=2823368 RepID=A0A8J7YS68_9ARCH|nr:aspartate aminotransferase family protein [Candidatus Sysuiplasma superficiale]MBX8643112.1 aspartate aminotransferase family protein [Candidatus Sysuiplasma superficiale]
MENLSSLSFEEAPLIRTEIPGPKSRELMEKQNAFETGSRTYTRQFRIAVRRGRGSTIEDMDGNVFIDWFAGVCVMNLGHSHPVVQKAMVRQLEEITHINEMPTESRISFLETLNSTLPQGLKNSARTMFTVTGGDACEAAVSLARHVTGNRTIVAFGGAYHGVAGDIVRATANYHYRQYAGIALQDVYHLPYPYSYRFPVKVREEEMSSFIVSHLEHLLRDPYAGPGPVAGVLVEPVQGEGGYVVPPSDFLPMLREVTEKYHVPLILDEVQSGVGRTGRIWASEHTGVSPDIMCISKSIGGGIPVSAIVYREDYDRNLPGGFHLGTYRGNPVALAAGNAILGYLRNSDVLERVNVLGRKLKSRFEEIARRYDEVGEVRGIGFMVATEMVSDRKSREPGTAIASKLKEQMFSRGVLMHTCGHYSNVMRFMAPLTIEERLIDKGADIYAEALDSVTKDTKH